MPELPWIFTRIDLRALVDILSVTLIFYWLLWVIQGTRAAQLVRGLVIFVILVVGAANLFHLQALNWLLSQALPALIVAIPVFPARAAPRTRAARAYWGLATHPFR
jgi:diadenylate cyclase